MWFLDGMYHVVGVVYLLHVGTVLTVQYAEYPEPNMTPSGSDNQIVDMWYLHVSLMIDMEVVDMRWLVYGIP